MEHEFLDSHETSGIFNVDEERDNKQENSGGVRAGLSLFERRRCTLSYLLLADIVGFGVSGGGRRSPFGALPPDETRGRGEESRFFPHRC